MIDIHKSMTERNPVTIGIVGTLAIIAILLLAFNFRSIPFLHGDSLVAEFSDASGLASGDPVMIAGVEVGKVTDISLDGGHVRVKFTADTSNQRLGVDTTAAIKVKTALGQRFIALTPAGNGELADGATIPLRRTTSGYDVTRSLQEVTAKVAHTDKPTLSSALDQLSKVQASLPDDLQSSLRGLGRLSQTVASRDSELRSLLENSATATSILSQRNQQLSALFGQGNTLFAALNNRATSIRRVVVQARQISDALSGLSADVKATMKPMLDRLGTVLDLLNKNYANIDKSITGLKMFSYQVGEAVASGPFFGVLLHNIVPADLSGQKPYSPGAPR